jgi:hypothetical protein
MTFKGSVRWQRWQRLTIDPFLLINVRFWPEAVQAPFSDQCAMPSTRQAVMHTQHQRRETDDPNPGSLFGANQRSASVSTSVRLWRCWAGVIVWQFSAGFGGSTSHA